MLESDEAASLAQDTSKTTATGATRMHQLASILKLGIAAILLAVVIVGIFVLLGRPSTAVAGVFEGGGEGFELSFTVDQDGAVSEFSLSTDQPMEFGMSGWWPIENGQFCASSLLDPSCNIEGNFAGDGTQASGTWLTRGGPVPWQAEHVGD